MTAVDLPLLTALAFGYIWLIASAWYGSRVTRMWWHHSSITVPWKTAICFAWVLHAITLGAYLSLTYGALT